MPIILDRSGQLKIQQMAFMLLAVTLFFVIVFLFFLLFSTSNLKKEKVDFEREKAEILVSKIASSPEFNFADVPRGVDFDKVMALKNNEKYKDYLGVDGIILRKIYPIGNNVECKIGNYPECNLIKLFTEKNNAVASSYVALCTKKESGGSSYDYCELGILMIDVNVTNDEKN